MFKPPPFTAVLAIVLLAGAPATAQRPDAALVGEWSGVAHVTSDWCLQRELGVRVRIHDDGTVEGQVGDATLRDGRFRSNRSVVARAMRLGTDWVIEGRLDGPIIRREAVVRDHVRLPLNWTGTALEGELATSGSYEQRRDDRVLLASGLVLRRVASAPTSTPR
ncbi:MAG TPA: hypothetical protein VFI52_13365 [Gemmatimonadaceae bacterium]|nr:hypothetical protein [Gemmatimonadaceae bacterium]